MLVTQSRVDVEKSHKPPIQTPLLPHASLLNHMTTEHSQKQEFIETLLAQQMTASSPILSKHQAYQKILIHASTYDDVDEPLEGLNVAAVKGCGHDATILERPLRLAFL